MSRSRSKRLDTVRQIALAEEQVASRQLGDAQLACDEHAYRLNELEQHRSSYQGSNQSIVDPVRWQDYQAFLARLDQAIDMQRELITSAENDLAESRRHWMLKRQRVDSLDKIILRYRQEEVAEQDRQEQKTLDALPVRPSFYSDYAS